jgi:hypothetical protein
MSNSQKKLWRQLEEERTEDGYPVGHEFQKRVDSFLGRRDAMGKH